MNAKNTDPNPSPAKRRKVETLRDYVMTSAEELDTMVTSCLNTIYPNVIQHNQRLFLKKIRRISKANHSKYALQLKEINLDMSALKQKIDRLEKRD